MEKNFCPLINADCKKSCVCYRDNKKLVYSQPNCVLVAGMDSLEYLYKGFKDVDAALEMIRYSIPK